MVGIGGRWSMTEATLVLLLPALERLRGGFAAVPELARILARADRQPAADGGREAQLLRHFTLLPKRLPVAPITRALDADDARLGGWLRADPAWLRADLASGRMMACGELGLSVAEVDSLLKPLKPIFGDEGFPISAPVPQRWYLAMPAEMQLPPLACPDDVLGDDLHPHLPQGDAGRRWRRLLSESQILLHNHPLNAERIAAGKPPVNSLWFWGGGVLPDHVQVGATVYSDDSLAAGLCKLAGSACLPLKSLADGDPDGAALVDLRELRDVGQLQSPWLPWALDMLGRSRLSSIDFDFADGMRFVYRARHRWRVWRRGLA
jgi:hypothetical protein